MDQSGLLEGVGPWNAALGGLHLVLSVLEELLLLLDLLHLLELLHLLQHQGLMLLLEEEHLVLLIVLHGAGLLVNDLGLESEAVT